MELTNVTVEQVEPNVVLMETEVPAGEVDHAIDQVYHEYSRRVALPGFRKGKIPREILRQRIGRDAIRQQAINRLLQPAYEKALNQSGLQPIDQVSVEVVEFNESSPFKFKTKVVTKPAVELGDYEHFEVERPQVEVTEEQVHRQLEELRRRYAQITEAADRGIQTGDVVWGTLEATIEGEDKPREPVDLRPFVVGENNLVPNLDNVVLGLRTGEVARFTFTYPEDFADAELMNKSARLSFEVVGFRERHLPELDDSFARQAGKFATLDELRNAIRRLLESEAESKAMKDLQEGLVAQVVERSRLELPEPLLEKRVERRIHNLAHELEEKNVSLEEYVDHYGITVEKLRAQTRDQVEQELRKQFVLEAIAGKEQLTVSPAEMDAQIAAMAKALKESSSVLHQRLEANGAIKYVEESVLERKASRLILERAGFGASPAGDEPGDEVEKLIDATSQQNEKNPAEEGRS